MVSSISVVSILVATVAAQAVTPDAPITPPTTCAPGVQVFVARGSTEAPGQGRIRTVAGNVTAAIPGSFITAVDYPATFEDYPQSVAKGTVKLGELVRDYVRLCPDGKIALLGFSQGAQAIADLVCGASSDLMPKSKDLDAIYDKNIIAMVLFGDPTRAANQSFNAGSVTDRDGLFPRLKNGDCEPYSPRLRSWCDNADRYCDPSAPGGIDSTVHGGYFNKYSQIAKDFVVKQWQLSQKASLPPKSSVAPLQPTGTHSTNGTRPVQTTGGSMPTKTGAVPVGGASRTGAAAVGAIFVAGAAALLI